RSDVVQNKNQTLGTGPTASRRSAPATQVKERVGRTTLFSSSARSPGRQSLPRVHRHQSPPPLIRMPRMHLDFALRRLGGAHRYHVPPGLFSARNIWYEECSSGHPRCYELSPLALEAL